MILYAQFDTLSGLVLDTCDYLDGSYADSACCITAGVTDSVYCIFQRKDSVYCRGLVYSPTTVPETRPDTWNLLGMLNDANSSGKHPYVERFGPSRIWATYRDSTGTMMGSCITIKRASRVINALGYDWEGMTAVSSTNASRKDWPVLSTGDVVVWSESTDYGWKLKAKVKDSLLTLTAAGDTNCKYGHVLAETSVADGPSTNKTRIRYLWTQQVKADTWAAQCTPQQDVKVSNADGNVTRYNNGAKLILGPGDTLRNVYRTNAGALYYARKYDDPGAGWSSQSIVSSGETPAIAKDWQGWLWVADRSTSAKQIRVQYRKVGTTVWTDHLAYECSAGASQDVVGPPSIVTALNDPDDADLTCAYVAFPVYSPGAKSSYSYVVMVKVDSSAVVYTDTLHNIKNLTDSFPCLSVRDNSGEGYYLHLVYQENGDVRYRKSTGTDEPNQTSKVAWSDTFSLSGGSSTARHPVVAAGSDSVRTAWAEGSTPAIKARNQAAGSSYNQWGSAFTVSSSPDTICDYPTISQGDSTIIAWHKYLTEQNPEIIACVNFGTKLNISSSSQASKYGHVVFEMHQGTPVIHTVWTEDLSTNYSEVGYKRWQLGVQGGGGGGQSATRLDPTIQPRLYPAQPNPFNHRTTIRYQVNMAGLTRVNIYDATGRLVRQLARNNLEPGTYTATWDARDNRNRNSPEGIYFVRLESPNYQESRKLVLTQ